jgi:hypothetical protein
MSTELLEATILEDDCLTSSLLLDFGVALEEDSFTALLLESSFLTEELLLSPPTELEEFLVVVEELDSFAFFSLEEDLPLSALFCELEEFLETSPLLELVSSQPSLCSSHWRGSGETEEEDSSPHAASRARRMDSAKMLKIFTEDLQL